MNEIWAISIFKSACIEFKFSLYQRLRSLYKLNASNYANSNGINSNFHIHMGHFKLKKKLQFRQSNYSKNKNIKCGIALDRNSI